MEKVNSFEVLVRLKIPFITSTLSRILLFVGVFLFGSLFFTMPGDPDQTPVISPSTYFIKIFEAAIVIFFTVLIIKSFAHINKKATITFNQWAISIIGNKLEINIPVDSIFKVYCFDVKTPQGESKNILNIEIKDKNKKITFVRLANYEQSDDFMNNFSSYKNIDIQFYDFNLPEDTTSV